MIYFLAVIIFGMYFILAMVIGWFQVRFRERNEETQRKRKLDSRTGIVAAFILLDLDSSDKLSWMELEMFLDALKSVK